MKVPHKKLRLHIDGRMLYMSGIGRCLREILKEMVKDDRLDITLSGKKDDFERYIDEYGIGLDKISFRKYGTPIYSASEQLIGSCNNLLHRNNYDIFFYPHYNLPFIINRNSMFIIHDFIQFKFPQYFGKNKVKIARMILNNAVKKAKKIITVSRSTADDFNRFFPGYDKKVEVIYNGISKRFMVMPDEEKERFRKKKGLGNYILFIGNNKPHKNIKGLVKAFKTIHEEYPDFKLVIISAGFSLEGLSLEDKVKKDIVILDGVTEEELILYYNCAFMLVLPSFYEGFGLPIIEAMACGCPVATSNISSMPEFGGDAAVYFDPYDISSIYKAIRVIIEDKDWRMSKINRGYKRVESFTWEEAAGKYIDILYNIL
jgi:glycosyltransferase involved in cell wall biosynthesis